MELISRSGGRARVRIAQVLTFLERHAPALAPWLKRWFVEYAVPMNRSIGLRIDRVTPDSRHVAVRLLPRRRNRNLEGTVHGAAITALAESVHGIAVLWQFSPAEHRMVSRELRLEFVAPARGVLTAEFALEEQVRARIEQDLRADGRCDLELASEVRDLHGRTVARLTGSYCIHRRGSGGDRASRRATDGAGRGSESTERMG